MIRNVLLGAVLAVVGSLAMAGRAPGGYVYVQVGPPAPMVEPVPARPGAGYVWVGGYWTWNGARYVWVHGRYVRHAGAWCAGRWVHEPHHGWYWRPGSWC
jgi:WXXGXW repeat (2 copies)